MKHHKQSLREAMEGWLAFDGHWFWEPESGLQGSLVWIVVIIAAMLAWGMWA